MAKKKKKGKKRGRKRMHSMHKAGFAGPLRKRGRPAGKKNKKKRSTGGKLPDAVIRKFAHSLKKRPHAAAIYREVLGC